MRISTMLKALGRGRLVKDGFFENLGKLNALEKIGTLVFLTEEKYLPNIENEFISAVIIKEDLVGKINRNDIAIVVDTNPKELFYEIHEYLIEINFYGSPEKTSISSTAIISDSAIITDHDVYIGENCVIEENVVIKPGVTIGANTIIGAGSVIGAEGYEPIYYKGKWKIAKHAGKVIIGSNVHIEANNCVSKGLFPSRNTIIGDQVLTDNLVHIAHGVQIGKGSRLAANAMIAGSVTIGENVWIGPGASISNGLKIGHNARISIGSVVTKDVEAGKTVTGNFAIDHHKFIEFIKSIR